ncbi:MAG: tetratricopeptide repeat protein [Acidobacteria bacterium]|nr:tetratricopeptide repeat protein [Acidobacteriota bacterium]MCA1639270.1 tetratricopeptide repeat protein [Acidobacteriota bacterium]
MKNLVLFVLISFAVLCVSAQTSQLSPTLQEAQKISAEVVKLYQQKKYDEALPLAERAISIRESELGKNHISVAQALRNLAYIQLQRERRKEAGKVFENALEIYEKNQPLSSNDEKTFAEVLETVAVYQAMNGDVVGAEKKFLRAVELREKVNGKESAETANSLLRLAQIYQLKGDYDKAAPLLLRALDIKTKRSVKLDEQADEIYSNAYCTLTKLNREEERIQLRERFYPKKADKDSDVENQKITINGGVVNGKALNLPAPPYPPEARLKGASGAVNVSVTIDETGKVIFACATTGAKEFHRVTEAAAYQSKFHPTTLQGKPVRVTGVIVYNFRP